MSAQIGGAANRGTANFVFVKESIGIRYWLPHETHLWVPGVENSKEPGFVIFKADNNDLVKVPEAEVEKLHQVHNDQVQGVEDICSLVDVNEAALLHTVRVRYAQTQIYTRVARTLIAVNPFTSLPIYNAQKLEEYTKCQDSQDLPPHIFGIGQDAIRGLRDTTVDQAVLVSGESGAGKTESAKLIMRYVADAMGSSDGDCMENVLRSNVVLEAFGNAMTVRNNNSSRFGKWLDLLFSPRRLESSGATLTSYLLETTRVINQAPKERGYHVFFQLLQAKKEFPDLKMEDPKKYNYLKNGQVKAGGIKDNECFDELKDSFDKFGMDSDRQLEIWTTLHAVLRLGNIEFKAKGEGSELTTKPALDQFAEMMQIDAAKLLDLMTIRKIAIGKDLTQALNRVDQTNSVRDGLARMLYGSLFLKLITDMNVQLSLGKSAEELAGDRMLGVLDIAGFECFEKNSMEQLLINLSNEHLQQHFNHSMIKSETEECTREGVTMPEIGGFTDNEDILSLLDAKAGVFDLLDETCLAKFAKTNDGTFVGKVTKAYKEHSKLLVPKTDREPVFGVKHFAGDVWYDCNGWLDKNLEKMPMELAEVLQSSGVGIIKELGEIREEDALSGAKRTKSVTSGFRSSLKELMAKITNAAPHYIRCVKPNMEKVAGRFTAPAVMEQLLFGGVLAAVNIRQQGYAYRVPHKDFTALYACVTERLPSELTDAERDRIDDLKKQGRAGGGGGPAVRKSVAYVSSDPKARAVHIIEGLPAVLYAIGYDIGPECFALGHTKVFTKFVAVKALDAARHRALRSVATHIQRIWRGVLSRRETKERKIVQAAILVILRKVDLGSSGGKEKKRRRATSDMTSVGESLMTRLGTLEAMNELIAELLPLLAKAEALEFDNLYVTEGDWVARRMRTELNAIEQVKKLGTSVDIVQIEKHLASVKQRLRLPDFPGLAELEKRGEILRVQVPLVKALEGGLDERKSMTGPALVDKLKELLKRVEDANLREDAGAWLPELKGVQIVGEVMKALEEELAKTDADAAAKLAEEREKNAQQAKDAAAAKKEDKPKPKAEPKKEAAPPPEPEPAAKMMAEEAFEKAMAEQRAKMEEEFQKMMEEQKAKMEEVLKSKLESDQAKEEAEKEKAEAKLASTAIESKLKQKMEAEREEMQDDLQRRLKEVTDKMAGERQVLEARVEEERSKAEEEHKLVEQRTKAEKAANEKLQQLTDEQRKKEAEHADTLAAERKKAAEKLEEKLAAERESAEKKLAEKCAAERAAATRDTAQEVKDKMDKEHAAASAELEKRLSDESSKEKKDMEERLLAQHTASVQAFAESMSDERKVAKKEFEVKLAAANESLNAAELKSKLLEVEVDAERSKTERARQLAEERAQAEREANEKLRTLEEERAAAEKTFKRTLEDERASAEKELQDKLESERLEAEKKLAERCAAERASAAHETAQELKDQMTKEHEAAAEALKAELQDKHRATEEELSKRLLAQHTIAQETFAQTMSAERTAAQKDFDEKLSAAEKLLAERAEAEQIVSFELEQERSKVEEQSKLIAEKDAAGREANEKLQKLSSEHSAAAEDFSKQLADSRMAAKKELQEKLAAEKEDAEKELQERLAAERADAERSATQEVKDQMAKEHAAAVAELEQKLMAKHQADEEELTARLMAEHTVSVQTFAQTMSAERQTARDEFDTKMSAANDRANASELQTKLLEGELGAERSKLELARAALEERAEAERLANEKYNKLAEERTAGEASFKKKLEDERLEAEKDLEAAIAAERKVAEKNLEEKCAAERAAAAHETAQDVKDKMAKEHEEAAAALTARLNEKHKASEEELAARLLAQHTTAQEVFAQSMATQSTLAQKEFDAKMEAAEKALAERAEAEQLVTQELQQERGKVEAQSKVIAEREAGERKAAEELSRLATERLASEENFAKQLADERMAAKRELTEKLEAERAEAEKTLAEKCAAERVAAEASASQETRDQLAKEHAVATAELEETMAEQHKSAQTELAARLLSEHTASVQSFAQTMSAERAEAQKRYEETISSVSDELKEARKDHKEELAAVLTKAETARKLAEERGEAERTANEKLKRSEEELVAAEGNFKRTLEAERKAAEQDLAHKLAAEQSEAQRELEERCTAERAAATAETSQEVKEQMEKEHAAAAAALKEKLVSEHRAKEDELAARMLAEHTAAQEVFAKTMATDRSTAQKEFDEKLAVAEKLLAEKAESEDVIMSQLEAERKKVDTQLKLISDREDAERAATEKFKRLAEERKAQEENFAKTLAAERIAAEEELANQLAKERKEAEDLLAETIEAERKKVASSTTADVQEKLQAEHRAAKSELERTLRQEHAQAEQELANNLVQDHTVAQQAFANKMAKEREAAESEFQEQLALEKAKAEEAGKTGEDKWSAEREAMEKDLGERLEVEKAAVAKEFMGRLDAARAEAEGAYSKTNNAVKRARKSIPGFKSERKQIVELISKAVNDYDIDSLDVFLGLAAEDGITDISSDDPDEDGPLKIATNFLNNCQVDSFITDMLDEYCEQADEENPPLLVCVRLANLIDQLRKLQGSPGVHHSSKVLQNAMVAMAKQRKIKSLFESTDADEVDLATKVFGKISNFSRMKDPSSFDKAGKKTPKGKKNRTRGVSFQADVLAAEASAAELSTTSPAESDALGYKAMLSHGTQSLTESLTSAPVDFKGEDFDSSSCLNLINIMTWMGDRPSQDCQRQSAHPAILDLASNTENYRDEIYTQLIKQLTENPGARAQERGWELMHHLIVSAPPSPVMAEFLRAFAASSQETLADSQETAEWGKERTQAVLDALKGSSVWRNVESAWENVFSVADYLNPFATK